MCDLPKWEYNGIEIDNIPKKAIGFVYRVNFSDGTSYIGKKLCRTTELKPALKNDKKRKNHIEFVGKIKNRKRVKYEKIYKELDWIKYIGSFDKKQYNDNTVKSREILSFHSTKKGMTYYEMYWIFKTHALVSNTYRNSNLQGTLFPKDIEEYKPNIKELKNDSIHNVE